MDTDPLQKNRDKNVSHKLEGPQNLHFLLLFPASDECNNTYSPDESVCLINGCAAQVKGQVLTLKGQTCSLGMAFTKSLLNFAEQRNEEMRMDYHARLKALGMSEQDIQQFNDYWKEHTERSCRLSVLSSLSEPIAVV